MRRFENIVNHQPVSCELATSLWRVEFHIRYRYSRTNTVPVEKILTILKISGPNIIKYASFRSRIWGYTSKKSLYRGEHQGHANPFIFWCNYAHLTHLRCKDFAVNFVRSKWELTMFTNRPTFPLMDFKVRAAHSFHELPDLVARCRLPL